MTTPLLILSDAPTSGTGLGRITRDLATRIHAGLPEVFEVATLGYGASQSRALGFLQYEVKMEDWVVLNLPEVWKDFAGERKGVLLTIWDASRTLWLARPENCRDARLRKFLTPRPFELWGYFPIDATGPNDCLTGVLGHTIAGYDRILAYSQWAADIVARTLNRSSGVRSEKEQAKPVIDNLPHGLDTSVFHPRNKHGARHGFGERNNFRLGTGKPVNVPDDSLMIGIVATNQLRKDWGLGVQVAAELAKERKVFLWCHSDVLIRHWSITDLVNDFGLLPFTVFSTVELTDEQLAWNYSACDVTLGIGAGEGYGFPIFESLACGTPCIHGNYGGAPEHIPDWLLVEPTAYRFEGVYGCVRPVYRMEDWVSAVKDLELCPDHVATLPPYLDWQNLWPRWAEWLKAGVK